MGIVQRINAVLEYKLEIDLEKRVSRNKSLAVIVLILILLNILGFYIGNRWFWVKTENYYENKVSNLKQMLKDNPGSKDVEAELAMTSYLNGDSETAVKQLREVLQRDPNNSSAQFNLGVILSEKKQFNEAIVFLNKYLRKNRGLEARIAYLYLGRCYLDTGKYDLALKNLKIAAERDPGNPVVLYYLGQTYEKLNNRKGAIRSYEKALEINSEYLEADRALISLLKRAKVK